MRRRILSMSWLIVLGCSDSTPEGQSAGKQPPMTVERQFWEWFVLNSAELATVKTGKERVCSELDKLLTNVEKGLTWEFGPSVEGVREFTISADGNKELFPRVKKLAAAAPVLPKWKVHALRQRRIIRAMTLTIDGDTVKAEDMRVLVVPEGAKVGVTVYVPGLKDSNKKRAMEQGFLLLDFALGEEDMELRVSSIDFLPLPDAEKARDLKPFTELAVVFDALRK